MDVLLESFMRQREETLQLSCHFLCLLTDWLTPPDKSMTWLMIRERWENRKQRLIYNARCYPRVRVCLLSLGGREEGEEDHTMQGRQGDHWSLFIGHTTSRVLLARNWEILWWFYWLYCKLLIHCHDINTRIYDPLTILDQTILGSFEWHRMFCQTMQGSFLFLFKSPAPLLNTIVTFWHFRVNVSIVLPPPNDADLSNKAVNTKYLSSRKIFQDTKITRGEAAVSCILILTEQCSLLLLCKKLNQVKAISSRDYPIPPPAPLSISHPWLWGIKTF